MKDLVSARDRYAPAPQIHVVVRKEDIDPERLPGRVAIVLDILFATTTIVSALDAGATAVIPAEDRHEALRIAATLPAGGYSIAGEDQMAAIPGFASPLPLELTREPGFAGRPLVYSTTNGTVALRRSSAADAVYAAALLNARATLGHVRAHHPGKPVVIVFYPFTFTGNCQGELCEIRDDPSAFERAGAQVLAISCDSRHSQRIWAEEQGFTFPVLSDFWPHGATAQAYGAFFEPGGFPMRATFIIDTDGIVRWSVVNGPGDARRTSDYREALAAL